MAPRIDEMGKAMDEPCPHLRPGPEGSCANYQRRLGVCRSFLCGWRLGMGEEEDRPDRLGVLIQPTKRGGEPILAFVEVKPEAMEAPRARALISQWGEAMGGQVVIRRHLSRDFVKVPLTVRGTQTG